MTVYELIQELARYDANDIIEIEVEFDTDDTLEMCKENKESKVERSILTGDVDHTEGKYKSVVISVDAY